MTFPGTEWSASLAGEPGREGTCTDDLHVTQDSDIEAACLDERFPDLSLVRLNRMELYRADECQSLCHESIDDFNSYRLPEFVGGNRPESEHRLSAADFLQLDASGSAKPPSTT